MIHPTRVIYKYPIDILECVERGFSYITVPLGYKPLSFQMQGMLPTLWMEVDPDKSVQQIKVKAKLEMTGIGFMPSPKDRYVGTIQDLTSGLVLHLYLEDEAV